MTVTIGKQATLTLRHNKLKTSWILLDNQSTADIFSNSNLLRNIRSAKTPKATCSHGGTKTADIQGDLLGYYNPKGIAIILSLSKVKKTFKVTYDSENGIIFTVHTPHGDIIF